MKLRIQGNSLRLRLTQRKSPTCVIAGGSSRSLFSPGHELVYQLEGSSHAQSVDAAFDGQAIRVTVPTRVMTQWVESDQAGIGASSSAGLQLLIEKYFQCLHVRGEQDLDAYANPLVS